MTTPTNGSHLTSSTELPAVRTPAAAPLEPAAPAVTTPETTPVAVTNPVPSTGLAADTRRERSDRLSRDKLIQASFELKQRVSHPDGGDSTVEEIAVDEADQRAEIDQATADGSRMHRRLPPWMRSVPKYVLAFDLGLLLYFFAGITNVDWGNPLSLALAFAIALAAMVTVLSFGFLSFTGHRLRSHKNHAGTIHPEDVDGITRAAFVVAIAVIVVVAVLMFTRIRTEVLYALGGQAQITALVIAVAVAVVNAVANFLVVAIHALDGSDESARLDKLSDAIRGPLAKAHRLRKQAAKQVNQQLSAKRRRPGTDPSRAFAYSVQPRTLRAALRLAAHPAVGVDLHRLGAGIGAPGAYISWMISARKRALWTGVSASVLSWLMISR